MVRIPPCDLLIIFLSDVVNESQFRHSRCSNWWKCSCCHLTHCWYMIESSSKRDFDIFWYCCYDITKSIIFHSHHHWSSHIRKNSENFKFPYSDLDSPQKLDLGTSWTIWIGQLFLTCPSWCPNHHFGCSTCHTQNWVSGPWYSESPWKMSLDASWTV